MLLKQLASGWHSPMTTSAGRLFDAVAAAIGVCRQRTYEGQPALELEMAADPEEHGFYPAEVQQNGDTLVLDTLAIFRGAVADRLSGQDNVVIASRFHQSLVQGLTQMCVMLRERTGLNLTALSGGVFQNALLVTRLKTSLAAAGVRSPDPQADAPQRRRHLPGPGSHSRRPAREELDCGGRG